jgi:hypothetical protein
MVAINTQRISVKKAFLIIAFVSSFIVLSAYAADYAGSVINQPEPDNDVGNVTVPQKGYPDANVTPEEYDYYSVNASGSKISLIVIDNRWFNIRQKSNLIRASSKKYGLTPVRDRVRGYVVEVHNGTNFGGRVYTGRRRFWASHHGIEGIRLTQDYVGRNPLLHEYMHLTQGYNALGDMEWFVEAEAEYYTLHMQQKEGAISAGRFNAMMIRRYVRSKFFGNSTLSKIQAQQIHSGNWAPYYKGSLVLSSLDAKVRNETDGNKTLLNVSRGLREDAGFLNSDALNQELKDVTGSGMRNWTRKYISGNQTPPPRLTNTHSPFTWISTLAWLGGILWICIALVATAGLAKQYIADEDG